MGIPVVQTYRIARYILEQKLKRNKRYPLVLMLEPLFRCNLACAGCGKIQYPADILKKNLSPEDCFRAVDECGAPMVSIPGGEPLLHPQMKEIVEGLVKRKKYVYLCTNALLLEKQLARFTPSKYLSFSVHIDGPRAEHDHAVCRDGTYDIAVSAIRAVITVAPSISTSGARRRNKAASCRSPMPCRRIAGCEVTVRKRSPKPIGPSRRTASIARSISFRPLKTDGNRPR